MQNDRTPWWDEARDSDAVARALSQVCISIRTQPAHTRHVARVRSHRALYENMSDAILTPGLDSEMMERAVATLTGPRVTWNVLRSVVDTAAALVGARQRPKPSFLTSGARFAERDRTMRANRLLEAVFRDGKAHDVALRAFRDACLDECGIVHVYSHEGRVRYERVDALTICVSAVEGRNEQPRTMYRTDVVDRQTLLRRFDISPRSARGRRILEAPAYTYAPNDPPELLQEGALASDVVRVFEAWRLPACDDIDEDDDKAAGRHVICTEDTVILDEPWKRSRFPFAIFRWASRTSGWWGYSLAEEVAPIQGEITYALTRIRRALHRVAVARVFVEKGSNPTPAAKMDRTIGQVVEYSGQPPVIDVPTAVGREWFDFFGMLVQQAYDGPGVSRMSATSQKPAGLASGEALREYNDLGADRAMTVSRAWETFHVDLAQCTIDALACDDEAGEREHIVEESRTATSSVKWNDVRMDRDRYVIAAHPTSMLARDFASRKQQVAEMVEAGLVPREQARRLLELPDIDRELDLSSATRSVVEKSIDQMLRDGVYIAPSPYHDLAYAVQLSAQTVALEELQGTDVDSPGMESVRQYGEAARTMLEEAEAKAAAAAAPAAPPMPEAPPMVPPEMMPAPMAGGGMIQ
jgi:hypothetical protein